MGKVRNAIEIAQTAWRSQHAIKPFSIHIAAIISVLVVPLQQAQENPVTFLPWLWVSLLAQIPTHFAVFGLWYLTYRKKEQPAWLIFVIGLIVGSVRGALVYRLGNQFVPQDLEFGLVERLVPASLSWMITIASLAIVNYLVFAPNEGWRKLQVELAEIQKDVLSSQEQLDWLVARRMQGLDRELRRDFVSLSNRVKDMDVSQSEAFSMLALELRRFAKENVRERSIEIWQGKKQPTPLTRAAWQAITNNPLPLASAIWVYASGFVLSEMRGRDLWSGFLLSLLATLCLAGLILLARKINVGSLTWLKLPAVSITQASVVVFLLDAEVVAGELSSVLPAFLAAGIWAGTSLFGAGWFTVGARLYRTEIQDLRARTSDAKQQLEWLEAKLETSNREIAKHLHGVVQSRLMAHAMELENRGKLGEVLDLDRVFDEIAPLIGLGSFGAKNRDLKGELGELENRWVGVVELEISLSETTDLNSGVAETIQLLQEAVTNALKHGRATKALIEISDHALTRQVIVTDNGQVRPEIENGLGKEIFDSICQGHWTLERTKSASKLSCKLALNSHLSV